MPEQSKTVEILTTSGEVIDALGGNSVVAAFFAAKDRVTPNAVGNWRERGFPPETFLAITKLLEARGLTALPALWKMREPAEARPD